MLPLGRAIMPQPDARFVDAPRGGHCRRRVGRDRHGTASRRPPRLARRGWRSGDAHSVTTQSHPFTNRQHARFQAGQPISSSISPLPDRRPGAGSLPNAIYPYWLLVRWTMLLGTSTREMSRSGPCDRPRDRNPSLDEDSSGPHVSRHARLKPSLGGVAKRSNAAVSKPFRAVPSDKGSNPSPSAHQPQSRTTTRDCRCRLD